MDRKPKSLSYFHPLIAGWFTDRVGRPTDIQQQAWPKIASGEHILISAPTGMGKTMAAFLWALNQLITKKWPTGHTSVLYVSPLKALNYDIQRNLLSPLEELQRVFQGAGEVFPEIRVLARTGDTPQSDRRRMLRHPPEILITTPESLNLLLSSPSGRIPLSRLFTVILDEIHSVVGNKRGVHLITAVERLVRLSGEFQRIALSATLRPLEMIAEFVGGFRFQGTLEHPSYEPRRVSTVCSALQKGYDLRVKHVRLIPEEDDPGDVWRPMVAEVKKIILQNRSTLIFVNSRRLCETLTLKINEGEKEPVAYSHHGSLSLDIRSEVERRLKAGELRAIVATHSLELGIDIGTIDEVILVQSPFSVSSAVQRVGRAGHRVGQISRGTFFPTHPRDFLEAAVLVPAILHHEIEEVKPILCPLDVLSQVIVSMAAAETWRMDSLFAALKTSYPYRHLSREHFDLVLNMLSGRYAHTLIRELKPRLSIDRLDGTVTLRKGALQALYSSGGMIPDRGYFHLRHQETRARVGELDEEFVWEASVGDIFSMGAQSWRIRQITPNDVLVLPAKSGGAAPFWKGEESGRDFHFSERIGRFLEEADKRLEDPDFLLLLRQERRFDESAAGHLIDFLKRQREETGCALPHRHHLVVESISTGPGGAPGNMVVIHNLWGGRVNRPLAMVLDAAWQSRFGHRLELFVGNDSVALLLPHELQAEELISLLDADRVDELLKKRLEGSGFFGARFRECAGRALLIERGRWGERMPLWMSRLRSQKLLEVVRQFEEFPVLLETWRTCLRDEFDLQNLKKLLSELASGVIAWTGVKAPHPSPFAASDWWRQVSKYMYMDDRPLADRASKLRGSLLREIIFQPGPRPTVSPEVVKKFEAKRHRISPGYSPAPGRELLEWVKERLLIPRGEWEQLLQAMQRDHGFDPDSLPEELKERLIRIHPLKTVEELVAAREMVGLILDHGYGASEAVRAETWDGSPLFRQDPSEENGEDLPWLLGQWLSFYGPKRSDFIGRTLGISENRLPAALEDLLDARKVVKGELVSGSGAEDVCDSENFEILLRMARADGQPIFEPLEVERLPLFLADFQGITKPGGDLAGLRERIEQLLGYSAEAGFWESEVFPARLQPYDPSWLDTLMQEGELKWVGSEGHRIAFCLESDFDLFREEEPGPTEDDDETPFSSGPEKREDRTSLFADPGMRYSFAALLARSHLSPEALGDELWKGVWQGKLTNDTFIALRQAIYTKFKLPDPISKDRRPQGRRGHLWGGLRRRGERRAIPGNWHLIPSAPPSHDLLEIEELRKDRVRLLLDRYGILFRELLLRELPPLTWPNVFRALRIMELSGEVLAGYFFKGIPGPQFASPSAFRRLQQNLPEGKIYWLNAADPASLCGIQLESLKRMLPARLSSNHLVYRGTLLVMVSKRLGKELIFHAPPQDPNLSQYFGPLRHLLNRKFQPLRRIAIETINEFPAPHSPYLPALRAAFEVIVDYKSVNLSRSKSSLP